MKPSFERQFEELTEQLKLTTLGASTRKPLQPTTPDRRFLNPPKTTVTVNKDVP